MRKIINMLLASMAAVGIYTSCTPEVDDVFDKSSAERIEDALAADKQILVSAQNGWKMEIFGNKDFGGYNLFLKFANDNTVEVASERTYDAETGEGADVRVTSHYKLEQSAGPILSFDEYNELIHFYSDPVNAEGMGTNGKGFEADLEYRILSASADSVVMTGKKHNNKIVLTPLAAGTDIAQTIKDIAKIKSEMESGNYTVTVGSKVYPASLSYRNLTIVTTNEAGERLDVKIPFVITQEGYKFYEPVTIDGHTMTGFKFVANSLEFPEFSDNSVILTAIVPPINEQFVNTIWFPSFSTLGAFGQTYWSYMNENVMPIVNGVYAGTLDYFYFGYEDGDFGAIYRIIGYWGVNGFDYELIGEDEIALTYNAAKNASNGATFIGSGFLNMAGYLVAPFGCTYDGQPLTRTFKITTDNIKKPSWVLLTDKNNPDNTIYMTAAEVYRPFEK